MCLLFWNHYFPMGQLFLPETIYLEWEAITQAYLKNG